MRCRRSAWMLATLLPACIEFTEVTEPRTGGAGARLEVWVDAPAVKPGKPGEPVALSTPDSIGVGALLFLGIDSRGERRRVLDDTLWVAGVPLLSTRAPEQDASLYRGTIVMDRERLRSTGATVRVPRVAGLERPGEIRWYAPRRLDPDTLLLRAGNDLHLHIGLPPEPAVRNGYWQFSLRGSSGQVGGFNQTALPATFAVSAALLPQPNAGLLAAEVHHSAVWGDTARSAGPTEYLAQVRVETRMQWAVRILSP